jgi:hypothetical protein
MFRGAKFLFAVMLLFVCCSQIAVAQRKLPVIKATWNIVPDARPDIYKTSSKKVTFYTDLDSISFNINPQIGIYDFIIILNGRDSAYTQIRYELSFLDKLKEAKDYNFSDNNLILKFTYQSMDNPSLVQIRHDFRLDSVAGSGNEISRILNLMHWVHNTVQHDGNSENPRLKNSADIIRVCKTGKRGVNCRMMATILNECYLAMGIKSRFVTCLPKDTTDTDCHVIDMVYSKSLKKWLWIDPTFDAYVMNENGVLLGIQEVRERLINGKPLILTPEANWNRINTQTQNYYLGYYMAKNLYKLSTPIASEYDTETWRTGKEIEYVDLLPLEGSERNKQKKERSFMDSGMKYTYYTSSNPNLFWATPE